jgi:hypothetical protein
VASEALHRQVPAPTAVPSTARLLLLAPALGLVPRLFDASIRPIGYNGFWHVFIARNLEREWRNLPHPPLFLVLLRAADALSHSTLAYRSVSLIAGISVVYLFGRLLLKLRARPAVAVLGALAVAFSGNAINLSNEVQSYSLCLLFLLASFSAYLDLADTGRPPSWRSRAAFAVFASLALASHYLTGLYLLVCALALPIAAAVRRDDRRALRSAIPRRWRADLLTLLPPVLVGSLLYEFQAKKFVQPLNELPGFYFEPGSETRIAFLSRNLHNTFNLFAPFALQRALFTLPLMAAFVAVVLAAAITERDGESGSPKRLLPALFLALLFPVGMILGVLGRYPFGGAMRQQVLFLVFGLLAFFVAFDRLLRAVRASAARTALVLIGAGAIALNFARELDALEHPAPEAFLPRIEAFSKEFPRWRVVHVDQFNLVGLFIKFHDWSWRFVGRERANHFIERYELTRGGQKRKLVAYRDWWNFDLESGAFYRELATAISEDRDPCDSLFCVYRTVYKPVRKLLPDAARTQREARISSFLTAEGLEPRRLLVSPNRDVFAEVCVQHELRVTEVVPPRTRAGVGFQIQPNGSSAVSVRGKGFRRGAVVVLGGRRLETTYGNAGWITATVPRDLYSAPGVLELRVVNADGKPSNTASFEIRP